MCKDCPNAQLTVDFNGLLWFLGERNRKIPLVMQLLVMQLGGEV